MKDKVLVIISFVICFAVTAWSAATSDLECEFPPKHEEDLTHSRRKRLTTKTGLVCLEDYPYTVSIRLHSKHWCGGAIVSEQWVISGAQCFDFVTKEEITVRAGSVFRDYGGKLLSVVDIRRHPKYKVDQYYPEHNLALIKLNVPLEIGLRIQKVPLAPGDMHTIPNYGEIVVTGYGSVIGLDGVWADFYPLLKKFFNKKTDSLSQLQRHFTSGHIRHGENQELRRMIVEEVAKAECRVLYGNDYQLQHDHICLRSRIKGVALCAGDIGDPAVHFSGGTSKIGVLHGIALFSGTEECSNKMKPGIYAKISYSRKWIDEVLNTHLAYNITGPLAVSAEGDVDIEKTDSYS